MYADNHPCLRTRVPLIFFIKRNDVNFRAAWPNIFLFANLPCVARYLPVSNMSFSYSIYHRQMKYGIYIYMCVVLCTQSQQSLVPFRQQYDSLDRILVAYNFILYLFISVSVEIP